MSRAEIYDPDTGEPRHPLLAERPEKNILLIVVTGDKGLAGAFNTNILKSGIEVHRVESRARISMSKCIGRKGRDFLRAPRSVGSREPADRRMSRASHRAHDVDRRRTCRRPGQGRVSPLLASWPRA